MNRSLANRIGLCRMTLRLKEKRKINQGEFGQIVARALGREKPLTKMTVSRWESGEVEPDIATLSAIAQVAEVDPGWLAFGEKSGARPPWTGDSPAQAQPVASELQRELLSDFQDQMLERAVKLDEKTIRELRSLAGKTDRKSNKRLREIVALLEEGGAIGRLERALRETDEEAEHRREYERLERAADARLGRL